MTRPMRGRACASLALLLAAAPAAAATLATTPFGTTADGKPVTLTTMASAHGVTVKFMSYGGIITEVIAPDRRGHPANIVLGFPTLHDYETKGAEGGFYFGALIGRYANRIAGGHFSLDGHDYTLPINNTPNALHGGLKGFDKQVWDVQPGPASGKPASGNSVSAILQYKSADGEEGYPGALSVKVTYTLADSNDFTVRYQAATDKDTVVNLTNHTYWNLGGAGSPDGTYAHTLMVDADRYTPTDKGSIPLGTLAPVAGTPFDFRKPTAVGAHIRADNDQLLLAHGYDHNWVLNKKPGGAPQLAAVAHDPASGRTLEVLTTEPGIQIYTSNFIKGDVAGNGGIFRQGDAYALETQHFPDSPNHPDFPTTELKPGQAFDSTTIFRLSLRP